MNIPIIYTGGSVQDRAHAIASHVATIPVSSFDIHRVQSENATGSLTIAQIKELQRVLSLSPVQGTIKVGILYELHRATPDAQNALLKLLEEPDTQTHLIATAERASLLLATITSRARIHVVTPRTTHETISDTTIFTTPDSEKLSYAEKLAQDTDTAYETMNGWVATLRHESIQQTLAGKYPRHIIARIRKILRAQQTLRRATISPRLLIENLLLEG